MGREGGDYECLWQFEGPGGLLMLAACAVAVVYCGHGGAAGTNSFVLLRPDVERGVGGGVRDCVLTRVSGVRGDDLREGGGHVDGQVHV